MSHGIRRILFATDFSDCSSAALESTAALARSLHAAVDVIYVSQVSPQLAAEVSARGSGFTDRHIREGRRKIGAVVAELESGGVEVCGAEVIPGFVAADAILRRAGSREFDLVVLGTHGCSGLARFWFGSVAERVVRGCAIPVLTVKARPLTEHHEAAR